MHHSANTKLKPVLILLATLTLAACAAKSPSPKPDADAQMPRDIPHELLQRFSIDPKTSTIHIHAYPDGPLAKFGHNHLIAVRQLEGEVLLSEPLAASRISLSFPVAELSVDDPDLRQSAGDDFSAPVPPKDRDGTRTNMLSPQLLNAGQFPRVEVMTRTISGDWPKLTADLSVLIAGRRQNLTVEATVKRENSLVEIDSAFSITHADLGLQPFSAMLGALKVRDALDIKLHLIAKTSD